MNNAGSAQISALEDYANADDFRKSVVSATGQSFLKLKNKKNPRSRKIVGSARLL